MIETGQLTFSYSRARSAAATSSPNASTSRRRTRRIASTSSVEQLPRRIQLSLDGCPRRKLRWPKPESFDTIAKPFAPVNRHTSSSEAAAPGL